jgi:membrane-bound serine protease (ClpP class)
VILIVGLVVGFLVVPDAWTVPTVILFGLLEAAETIWEIRFSRRRRPRVGVEALEGVTGRVVETCDPEGSVRVRGEIWSARSATGDDLGRDRAVRVVGRDRLVLLVEPTAESAMGQFGRDATGR